MAGVHLLPLPESQLSLVVLLAALCIAALGVFPLVDLVHQIGGGWLAAYAAVVAYGLSEPILVWTRAGLETSPLMVGTCLIGTLPT